MDISRIVINNTDQNSQDFCFDMKQKIQPVDPAHNLMGGRYKMMPVSFEGRVIVSYADLNFRSEFFDFIHTFPGGQGEIIRRPLTNSIINPQDESLSWLNVYYFLTSVEGLQIMADGAVHLACSMNLSGDYRVIYMRWGGQGLVLRSYPLQAYSKLATGQRYWLSTDKQEVSVGVPVVIGNQHYFA